MSPACTPAPTIASASRRTKHGLGFLLDTPACSHQRRGKGVLDGIRGALTGALAASLTVLANGAIVRPLFPPPADIACRRSPSRICPRPIAWLNGGAGLSAQGEVSFLAPTAPLKPSRV